eukprot:CAMPEP_0170579748 /NCGR_PEP_ID=MMETSP0224-20130122/6143_1 /TAXON_ID=285029 /ORGANISM="Togula jolla, Strain CCCM 725" /LENGTH=183 /DNA_ID=CAMNT_0010902781 /DNA_START=173 /DNA_END=725 /DNA_ORIENTATION=+
MSLKLPQARNASAEPEAIQVVLDHLGACLTGGLLAGQSLLQRVHRGLPVVSFLGDDFAEALLQGLPAPGLVGNVYEELFHNRLHGTSCCPFPDKAVLHFSHVGRVPTYPHGTLRLLAGALLQPLNLLEPLLKVVEARLEGVLVFCESALQMCLLRLRHCIDAVPRRSRQGLPGGLLNLKKLQT